MGGGWRAILNLVLPEATTPSDYATCSVGEARYLLGVRSVIEPLLIDNRLARRLPTDQTLAMLVRTQRVAVQMKMKKKKSVESWRHQKRLIHLIACDDVVGKRSGR